MAHLRPMGANARTVAQRRCKCERQATAMPSDKFRQMLGLVPHTVYTEKSVRPAEREI